MTSSRLPGKPLLDIAGKPLIQHVLDRTRLIEGCNAVVLATTTNPADRALVEFARDNDTEFYCGDGEDVAGRFLACAQKYSADYCIRANGDSPFLDPGLISKGLKLRTPTTDLVTNLVSRTFPYGVSVEIISVAALNKVYRHFEPEDYEHVTRVFYKNPERFEIQQLEPANSDLSSVRLTVDTSNDADTMRNLFALIGDTGPDTDYRHVSDVYKKHIVQ